MASYRVEVSQQARGEIRRLPGNVRQRIFRTIQALEHTPRPPESRALEMNGVGGKVPEAMVACRIRIARWRIVYVIEEDARRVTILGIRKRPPYQYDDLEKLLAEFGE